MADSENFIDSNTACTGERGVYDGWFHAYTPGGHRDIIFSVDLGHRLPPKAVEEPAVLFHWALLRAVEQRRATGKRQINPRLVVAASISRMCQQRRHEAPPKMAPYVSRRRELVMNIFVARERAEPFKVFTAQSTAFDANGCGSLVHSEDHFAVPEALAMPFSNPVVPIEGRAGRGRDLHPVIAGLELNTGGRHIAAAALHDLPELEKIIYPHDVWPQAK